MNSTNVAVSVRGELVRLMPVTVGLGLTNEQAPMTCGHRHQPGDTFWVRADLGLPRVMLCDPCAQAQSRGRQ